MYLVSIMVCIGMFVDLDVEAYILVSIVVFIRYVLFCIGMYKQVFICILDCKIQSKHSSFVL